MGKNLQRTLEISMSFSLRYFFISVTISTQVASTPLNCRFSNNNNNNNNNNNQNNSNNNKMFIMLYKYLIFIILYI